MQSVLDSGAAMAAILEDDAILTPEFAATIAAIQAHAPSFDVIDLHRNFKKTESFLPRHQLAGGVILGRIGPMNMNLTAYVISAAGAAKYLARPARFVHAIDKDLHSYWKNGLDIYGLQTPVAAQDPSIPSYIDETRHQNAISQRPTYPAAQAAHWRLIRRVTRLTDSLQKRIAFLALRRLP
jgi:GR25 family glycosyltransferase involved in LPS biosynthesis